MLRIVLEKGQVGAKGGSPRTCLGVRCFTESTALEQEAETPVGVCQAGGPGRMGSLLPGQWSFGLWGHAGEGKTKEEVPGAVSSAKELVYPEGSGKSP